MVSKDKIIVLEHTHSAFTQRGILKWDRVWKQVATKVDERKRKILRLIYSARHWANGVATNAVIKPRQRCINMTNWCFPLESALCCFCSSVYFIWYKDKVGCWKGFIFTELDFKKKFLICLCVYLCNKINYTVLNWSPGSDVWPGWSLFMVFSLYNRQKSVCIPNRLAHIQVVHFCSPTHACRPPKWC